MANIYKNRFSEEVRKYLSDDEWLHVEENYDRLANYENESIFALTSGKMSSRGAHEEGFSLKSLPAHYVHGVFDRSEAYQRELVNTPDWAKLKMYVSLEPIALETGQGISDYIRVLDLKNGLVAKHYIHESREGRKTQVEIVKYMSREHQTVGGFRYYITPLNYEEVIEFENIIDATVTNFLDYPRFRVKHLTVRDVFSLGGDGVGVLTETRDFLQAVCTTAAVRMSDLNGEEISTNREFKPFGEVACEFFDAKPKEGQTIVIDKFAAVAAEKDGFDVRKVSEHDLRIAIEEGFEHHLEKNREIYAEMWKRADIKVSGDEKMQKGLRFNIFHLMGTPNPRDNMTNLGPKLMHGEEYGGHAFWDTELFMLPFFSLVFPEIAKNLVEYRYNMLPGAKRNAKKRGGLGARYPWQSADTGDEECPEWTILYDGSVEPCTVADEEVHVTADVIYGGMQYYLYTGDDEYFYNNLIEMLIETSRFWLSRLEWNAAQERFEITGITGPDEWHENVSNNTFTNYMTRWSLQYAAQELQKVQVDRPEIYARIAKKVDFDPAEIDKWLETAELIYVPEAAEDGLIEQFEGYFDLHDKEIYEYNDNNMPLWPEELKQYPREETTILKQADIVMLMFLFRDVFPMEVQRRNFEYYEKRTMHGSSLSPSIYCLMGVHTGNDKLAYEYLERTTYIDLENKNNNTREGLHAAAMGGTWQAVVFGYGGLTVFKNGEIHFDPNLPKEWSGLEFRFVYRGALLTVNLTHDDIKVTSDKDEKLNYYYNGELKEVEIAG